MGRLEVWIEKKVCECKSKRPDHERPDTNQLSGDIINKNQPLGLFQQGLLAAD
jgi:hypothetical protein